MSKVICPEPGVQMTLSSTTIPTWRERYKAYPHRCPDIHFAMEEEIADLRKVLATIENETIERCAKIAETAAHRLGGYQFAATAIRALKRG